MDLLWSGVRQAIALIAGADREIWGILWLSLQVSGSATLIALALASRPARRWRSRAFPGAGSS